MAESVELLFFDTFSHESSEELNLDLVQFPKPVFVTEVRIIPLGARVQADFPGGVRLGATNPSQFSIEFFVNDLGKPGASTFESLGGFDYNQNGCIHLECINNEVNVRQIPTDGLVLRGWYTTITLAVYGTLTKNITEQVIPVASNAPSITQQPTTHVADVQQIVSANTIEPSWQQDVPIQQGPLEYSQQNQVAYGNSYGQTEGYSQDYHHMDYYNNDAPKDPRYHHTPENEWEQKSSRQRDTSRPRDGDHSRDTDHAHRDTDRHYSRSHSRDRDRRPAEYRETSRDKDREWERDRSQSQEYRERDRDRERDKDWDRGYKHQDAYKRQRDSSYGRGISQERDETRKRPRTPPMASPKRPHTPHGEKELSPGDVESISEDEIAAGNNEKVDKAAEVLQTKPETKVPDQQQKVPVKAETNECIEEAGAMDLEQFEPILSDEDICDETENFQDIDYDFAAYSNNDDVIKLFNPLTVELQKYRNSSYINIRKLIGESSDNNKAFEEINKHFAKFTEQTNNLISTLKSHMNKYGINDFKNFSPEVKEEFVFVCEQLPTHLNNNQQYFDFVELYSLVKDGEINPNRLGSYYNELKSIQKTLIDFVIISLDFDFAYSQNQPGFKIRHMKCGVRLTESCCSTQQFTDLLVEQNIHAKLLNLFDKEFMALSIKLLILKALDSTLCSENSIERFLADKVWADRNGYQSLIHILKNCSSARIKFAIKSLMTKLNIYEVIKKLKTTVFEWVTNKSELISEEQIAFVIEALDQIGKLVQKGPVELSQPKRFLPVAAQFEINRSEEKNTLYHLFSMHSLHDCFLILLSHPKTSQCNSIVSLISELMQELLNSSEGLDFLADNIKITNTIMKCFLHPEDLDSQYILSESVYIKSQSLGLAIAFKLQALYHVECLLDAGPRNNFDCDVNEVLDQLHSLFCLTYVNIGKLACSEVLSFDDNIRSLLQFLNWMQKDSERKDQLYTKLKKSPGIGYIIDLLALTVVHSSNVPFLGKYGKQILDISQQHDKFETSTAVKLNEILAYLKPLENTSIFSYDDIRFLCETLKQNIENVTNFPGQLITALRILKHLGISNHNNQNSVLQENCNYNLVELKYKYVILQLFSLDGVTNLVSILQKMCEFYEQPNLHVTTFTSFHGAVIMNTVLPCVQLLRQMLMNVIHCRNTDYKDLTAVPVLLQTFNLAHSFPASSIAYSKAREVCKEVISTLLVYSQPLSEEVSENDSLTKTLWTLMSGEVIKYITLAPYTFIPGLLIFSEILPLPLPYQTSVPLTDEEIKRAINLRKLWSAHLHTYSTGIQELINRLCTSVHQPLLHLLRRVCIQLSDLAANTAIMIARGVLDSVHVALTPKTEKLQAIVCNGHTARLLHFLACLTTHGAIKCAVLQLLWSHANALKTDERYPTLVNMFCHVLKTQSDSQSHLQAQECIVNIIQNLCDTEITLIQSSDGIKSDITSEMYLANSLPPKDMLITFLSTLLEHFTSDNTFTTLLPIVRTFILLSEHDYGFHHMCACFEKKPYCFLNILKKFINSYSKDNAELLQIMSTVFDFLRMCCDDMEVEGTLMFTPRSVKLSAKELKQLIGWKNEEYVEENSKHPFYVLETLLKKTCANQETMENMLDNLSNMIRFISSSEESSSTETNNVSSEEQNSISGSGSGVCTVSTSVIVTVTSMTEPILPAPETLLGQFACRPVFNVSEVSEEQLTTSYWLSAPSDDGGTDADHVACDLTEICRQQFSTEVNLNREVEKILRVCPSQETDRPTSEQIKTKRVINEAQRNDRMKRPYVTPMRGRGFPRTAPQRGDLFRSRPPNTSRPPSLHVDDFVALETCGAQPTGPTGYNKLSRDLLNTRVVRSVRGRTFISPDRAAVHFRPL